MPPKHNHRTGKWSHGPKTLPAEAPPPIAQIGMPMNPSTMSGSVEPNPSIGNARGSSLSGLETTGIGAPDQNLGPTDVPVLGPPTLPMSAKLRTKMRS